MKMKFKRFLSGVMAVATLASVIVQPVAVSASELEPEEIPFEQQYPELKEVQDSLDPDEIVAANDIELAYGQEFEVEVDLSGIDGVDESKIKIMFHEAKNESGADFDTHTPDTYKAVYAVEPVSGHPSYRISRNITVKEPETEMQSESSSEITVDDDSGTGDTEQSDDDSESHRENTVDTKTELTVSEVLEQAETNGIDLYAMDAGETVTFMASAGNARSSQQVSVTRGTMYRYADYGYGSYLTYQYTVKFGNVSATAYCVQPSKPGPGSGTYTINKVGDGKALAKVCYYGTKASGDDGFFTEENGYGNLSAGAKFILVHLAASYANGSGDAFSGANSTAQNLAKKLYNYCVSQPDIPSVAMSFSDANVKAYVEGNSQRTKDITFKADALQTITMKLPAGVKLHNLSTGKTSKAGANVEICGGTKFYLSAPLTQVSDVAESWSTTMKGSITKDYSAYKISTGSGNQDLALVFGEGVDDEKYVDFKVSWIELATVEVMKKDSAADVNLAGAVFGIYSDADCKNLITTMPETDSNGKSSATIVKTQDTVYLKEITAPKGYVVNTTAYNVKLVASKTTTTTVPDKEQLGELTVYKEGQVLAGADVSENGTVFQYENRRQKGAVYNVYAGEDIISAYGAKIYSKGDLVKENLSTDENGACILKNLHLGTYVVKEMQAPENFYNAGEEKTVTLSYAGQNVEVVFSDVIFTNDRQKADVSVVKKDKDTENPLSGGVFALYAGSDIANADGNVVVKKGTLIEKLTTGADGKAAFNADLPIGFSYVVKEEQAPQGYLRNSKDVYTFKFSYTSDSEPKVSFTHIFVNERVKAKISLEKRDAETKQAVAQGDATLEKAVYGLYARNDIVHPDGITGVIYKAGEQVATLTTDKNGQASVGGWISHLFQYVTGSLKDVTFEVFALEDVKSADGESEDYYKKDELVATITTDDTGIAKLSGLPLGKYYVKEKATVDGFVLDNEAREIDLTYRDQDTAEVTYSADWQNNRQKAEVEVVKKEKDSDRVLEGAVFALCAKNDITGADGKVILEADTVIEELATDKEGKLTFTADLPIGFEYYIKETSPAPGFATTDETQEFTFEYEGAEKEKVFYSFTFEDEPTVIEITKTSLTDGKELEGAKLQVTDESGKVVDSWISGKEAHIIKELVVGQKYTLTETKPADGFVTAESITFTVEDTVETQKIEMKDDITKVEISKTDISGKELPGAKLTILDKDGKTVESWTSEEKPHYIEMLPIGEYTLREESAPNGYLIAEDVKFTVEDTGEIQKVVMKDEVKPEETSTPETPSTQVTDTPKTGDDTHMLLWILLAVAGMAGVVSAVWVARKKK